VYRTDPDKIATCSRPASIGARSRTCTSTSTASPVMRTHSHREITLAGALDPIPFWPYADTIGGSRWPGDRGGPRFS
jgi:hypothetical protein